MLDPMSEGPTSRDRFQFNLRRSLYGWTGATLSLVASACFVCWIVTITSTQAEAPAIRLIDAYVSADSGSIIVCSKFGQSIESMDDWASRPGFVNEDYRKLDLPGFRCRQHVYSDADWAVEFSIIFPFLMFAILAAISLYRYRVICLKPAKCGRS
ncbi:MAG: hypothetical protein WD845_16590 [Pirellulales bacterium]